MATTKNPLTDLSDKPFWSMPQSELTRLLKSDPQAGLSAGEAEKRLQTIGPNQLQKKRDTKAIGLFLNQFKSPIVIILIIATIISAFLQDWTDAIIILLIVLISAGLSFWQEYSASNAAQKLRAQISTKAQTIRDGKPVFVPVEDIVPGDIVLLSAGSLIPADGIILEAKDFFVNQAVLTGETYPVEKKPGEVAENASLAERNNTVFMGTNVRSGSARILIAQTGPATAFGQIANRLTLRPPETEFERGIRRLGNLLTEVMLVLVFVIFALNVAFHKPVLDSFLFAIALAVGLTPQLLPAIININLSKGSQNMAKRGVIIRRLESIENFGSMDILCTDKTGTLTVGIMQLDKALDPAGQPSESTLRLAWMNAHFQSGLTNPLDEAINAKTQYDISQVIKVDEIPYDFIRKRLSVVVQEGKTFTLITKGALEGVIGVCSHLQSDNQTKVLDNKQKGVIQDSYENWSKQGYRVLGVAYRDVPAQAEPYHQNDEIDLVFAGFLLFFDPPKEGVQEVIQSLDRSGVQLKIITGDNRFVAQHTAQAIGLDAERILTSTQLDELRDEALWNAAEHTTIFAEVDPNEKERIILALKKTGHVVGYMGDGINDAPSLHSADVGISVENAVDVAKEAADLVLLKHDLSVLLTGIQEGRKTFANTLKYVFMAVSANFGNMFSMAGASLFLPFLPMLPKQILLINILTDLPEMTIASDNVDPIYIERPHRWNIGFIQRFMLVFGPLSSIFDLATFGILLWVLKANQVQFHTGWFIESVVSACLVVFALRTRAPIGQIQPSRSLLLMSGVVAVVTLLIPYTPLALLFGFTPLPPIILVVMMVIIGVYFLSAEFTKRWFFKRFSL
jgi:Mg2+-importing ATPase